PFLSRFLMPDLNEIFFQRIAKRRREQQKRSREAWLWIRVSGSASLRELLMFRAHAPEVLHDIARGMGLTVQALLATAERRNISEARVIAALERVWTES